MAIHTAILIGVGVTVHRNQQDGGQPEDKSLAGAVADVQGVKSFLLTASRPVDIIMLTASRKPGDGLFSRPIEAPDSLPTRKNVLDALKRVAKNCQVGHQVYIHFSGHGTRRPVPDHYNRSWESVAMVLFSDLPDGSEYLFAETLHKYIGMITEKGAYVTLVLDCCFSGSVMRTEAHLDSLIRFVEYDYNNADENQCVERLSTDEIEIEAAEHQRGAMMRFNWRMALDSQSYTMLTACGFDEIALECRLDDGTRMGAMTKFLLESLTALRNIGTKVSNRSLHQAICARIHSQLTHQTPMLYGRGGLSFFDDLLFKDGMDFVPLYRNNDGRIVLAAGQAHGVQSGDTYAAYRFTASEQASGTPYVRLEVQVLHGLTSWMSSLGAGEDKEIGRGSSWKGKFLNSAPARKAHVRLMSSIPNEVQQQLLAKTQGRYRFALSLDAETGSPALYQVSATKKDSFSIQDTASHHVVDTVPLSNGPDGPQMELILTLDHLVVYNAFQSLQNRQPDPDFEVSFTCEAFYQPENEDSPWFNITPGPDRFYDVREGEMFQVQFNNMGQQTLYLAVVMLSSNWSIENILASDGAGDYVTLLPRRTHQSGDTGEHKIPIYMSLSPAIIKAGLLQDWDILKIFVTSAPTTFPVVVLPPISEGVSRGSLNSLQSVLDQFSTGPSRTRSDGCKWTVREFYIRTSRQS